MLQGVGRTLKPLPNIVKAEGADPIFKPGDHVEISMRLPIVPSYMSWALPSFTLSDTRPKINAPEVFHA